MYVVFQSIELDKNVRTDLFGSLFVMFLFYFFQVPIKSITEFHKLYLSWCDSRKSVQKVANELPRRSHKGLIVHVLSPNENGDTHLVGKMNFIDLAGFPNFQHLC